MERGGDTRFSVWTEDDAVGEFGWGFGVGGGGLLGRCCGGCGRRHFFFSFFACFSVLWLRKECVGVAADVDADACFEMLGWARTAASGGRDAGRGGGGRPIGWERGGRSAMCDVERMVGWISVYCSLGDVMVWAQ